MDLTIRMKIFNNLRRCRTIFLKFGDIFLPSLTKLALKAKAIIYL